MKSLVILIKSFLRRPFMRRAAVFQVANGIASVLQSIAGVILARILKPELFGQYALAFSVASVASIILASGIQDALMPIIARSYANRDTSGVLDSFSYWLKWIGVSVFCVGVIALVLPSLTTWLYHNQSIGIFAAVVLVAALISSSLLSIAQVATQVAGRISALSLLTLGELVVRNGVAVLFVIVGFGALGATIGHLIGALIMAAIAWLVLLVLMRKDSLIPSVAAMIRRTRFVPWKLHRSQVVWVWIDRNFGMLYQALPLTILGTAVVATQIADFKLAFGYVNTGMALLGPLSILLNTEFARMQVESPKRLIRNFLVISLAGMGLGALVSVACALVGHWVFLFLYGSAYAGGVPLVYGLIPYGALFGLGIGLGPMWRTIGRVRRSVIINAVVLMVGFPIGLWAVGRYGVWGGVVMVTFWYGVSHLLSFAAVLHEARAMRDWKPLA